MKIYSKRGVNLLTFIIAVLLFLQMNFFYFKLMQIDTNKNTTIEVKLSPLEEKQVVEQKSIEEWVLKIPTIDLIAPIKDGIEGEIINSYVGHFKESAYQEGNIGLAAHNEGYKENYFKNLEKLKQGDKIIYQKGKFQKEYYVTENVIIDETNWTYLRNTTDNRITLITCLANNPTKRRCVQALEI